MALLDRAAQSGAGVVDAPVRQVAATPSPPPPAAVSTHANGKSPPEHTTWEAEAFIPVSRFEIQERLIERQGWGNLEPDAIRRLFRYFAAWRHVIYKERLDELERTYLPFSPETDLLRVGEFDETQRQGYRARFIAGVKRLLKQANFIEVPREKVRAMMDRSSAYGLELLVDLDDFEECVIFRRGTDFKTEQRRSWRTLYLWEREVRFPIYQRLFVLLKLWPEEERIRQVAEERKVPDRKAARLTRKSRQSLPDGLDSDKIYIKLFKDIPHADLEMLFPNTRVQLSRFDKIRLGGSAAGGVGLGLFGAITKIMAAAVLSPYVLGVAIFGVGGVILRQIMSFFNQRNQYMKVLAENLYFHSLADNRSAFTLLANRAEEEDVKEDMLLYTVLATENVHRHELPDVKSHISGFLREQFEVDVDFDAEDALGRLTRDGVVTEAPDGRLKAMAPLEAMQHLDEMWDGYLQPHGMDRRLIEEDAAT